MNHNILNDINLHSIYIQIIDSAVYNNLTLYDILSYPWVDEHPPAIVVFTRAPEFPTPWSFWCRGFSNLL